jgi:hypothetical protein
MTPNLFIFSEAPAPYVEGPRFSPLVLADRLITLAQEADRAGYPDSASRLIGLVYAVLDDEKVQAAAA